jgi:hypothetical protein
VDALVYPRFSGVPTFMRLPHIPRADELDIAVIGIPFDGGTTYRPVISSSTVNLPAIRQRYLFALRDTLRPRLTPQKLRPRGFACGPDCRLHSEGEDPIHLANSTVS